MIALAREEATTNFGAEARTKISLSDLSTGLKLPPIGDDRIATGSLSGEAGAGTPQTSGAMLNPTADAGTLTTAAETGLKMGITGRNLGHEAPPSASKPRGLPAIYFPLSP